MDTGYAAAGPDLSAAASHIGWGSPKPTRLVEAAAAVAAMADYVSAERLGIPVAFLAAENWDIQWAAESELLVLLARVLVA